MDILTDSPKIETSSHGWKPSKIFHDFTKIRFKSGLQHDFGSNGITTYEQPLQKRTRIYQMKSTFSFSRNALDDFEECIKTDHLYHSGKGHAILKDNKTLETCENCHGINTNLH